MPGLISATAPGATGTNNGQAITGTDAAQIDPTLRTVDPNQDTVQGQLNSILSKGSPYIDSARAGAMDTANSRGLLNTSIAAGAGEKAAIESALPIAQQDANTYSTNAATNQNADNTAKITNAAATNTANLNTAQAANASTLSSQQAQQDTSLQTLKGTQATNLANIEANYKSLMQTSASAASLFNDTQQQIAAILGDTRTSAEQKASAVSSITAALNSGLTVIGQISNLDLAGLLDFSNPASPVPA